MNNKVASGIATLSCSIFWVAILVALPFVEEYFDPSGSSSSWQGGLVVTPFMVVPALLAFHFICVKSTKAGYVTFVQFVVKASLNGFLLLLSLGLPALILSFIIDLTITANLLAVSGYLLLITYLTLLPPLSLWWLIALRNHDQSSKKSARTSRQ